MAHLDRPVAAPRRTRAAALALAPLVLAGLVALPSAPAAAATRPTISVAASPARPVMGRPASLVGTVKPASPRRTVQLQTYLQGAWRPVRNGATRLDGASRYRLAIPTRASGTYTYRVVLPKVGNQPGSTSPTLKVRVYAPAPKPAPAPSPSATSTPAPAPAPGPTATSSPTPAPTPSPTSPATVPGQVREVVARPGDASAELSFTPPSDGGAPISRYSVRFGEFRDGVLLRQATVDLGASQRTVTGLTNGLGYSFEVAACNAAGCGPLSPFSDAVTPYGVPAAPTISGRTDGDWLYWSWTVPAANGSPVTGYDLYVDGSLFGSFPTASENGVKFACGQTHSAYVRAKNARGSGAASATDSRATAACPAPAPAPAPAPQTWRETTGPGGASTHTNYMNAGGTSGPRIPPNATVEVACKVQGFKVANGNPWWYRIHSSPWNNTYYASADTFYNNGQTSGSLAGTPYVDPAVRDC